MPDLYCEDRQCLKKTSVSDDVYDDYLNGDREPWLCDRHILAAERVHLHNKVAELRYATPLAFCIWLQKNFDRLVIELNSKQQTSALAAQR